MSDASVQRVMARRSGVADRKPFPRGVGLLIGAAVSVGLWLAIFWLTGQVFG